MITIKDNTRELLIKHKRGVNLSIRMAMDAIDAEAFRKTPKDKGELRKNLKKHVSDSTGTIIWKSKYASSQERGFTTGPVRHYTTPGTGPHFAENAVMKISKKYPDLYFRSVKL